MNLPTRSDSRKVLRRQRMLATMGQVTTCSYNCHDYSEAVALRKEDWINGCWSGKQISRMLRNLH